MRGSGLVGRPAVALSDVDCQCETDLHVSEGGRVVLTINCPVQRRHVYRRKLRVDGDNSAGAGGSFRPQSRSPPSAPFADSYTAPGKVSVVELQHRAAKGPPGTHSG